MHTSTCVLQILKLKHIYQSRESLMPFANKKKWANPGPFLFIFGLFKQTLQFLQQINVKNVHPVYGSRPSHVNFGVKKFPARDWNFSSKF